MKTPADSILVLGGGPAGSVCARELARRGHCVHLMTGHPPRPRAFRETAGPSFTRMMANEGLVLPTEYGRPLAHFWAAWGSDALEMKVSHFWQVTDAITLNRPLLDRWFVDQAKSAGVIVHSDCFAVRTDKIGNDWRVGVRSRVAETEVRGRFIVESTGRVSGSVCHAEARRHYTDQLVCVSTIVFTEEGPEVEAFVEAGKNGWWYLVRDGRYSFVAYFTDADQIPILSERRAWFESRLMETQHVQRLVLAGNMREEVRVRDARTSIRTIVWRDSWIAVGDASWTLDPLSGNGIERAVQSGIAAGRALSESILEETNRPLRDFAINQVNSFHAALESQNRIYNSEARFDSHFWQRRRGNDNSPRIDA